MSEIKDLVKEYVAKELSSAKPPQFHAIPASAMRDVAQGGGQDFLIPRAESVIEIFAHLAEVTYSAKAINDVLMAFILELEEEDSSVLETILPKVKKRLARAQEMAKEEARKQKEAEKKKAGVLQPQKNIILPQ